MTHPIDLTPPSNAVTRQAEGLERYLSRAVESAQVIEVLIAMAKEFREAALRGDKLGLNQSELAFYDALTDNETPCANWVTRY
jgi:type I restriction enzyme R subunit